MLRVDMHGIFCDISAFIGRNKFKFLVMILLVVAAFVFGIRNAFVIRTTEELFPRLKKYDVVLLIIGERGFFSYFFGRLFWNLLILVLLSFLGIKVFTSYLSYAVVVLYAYQSAFFIGALLCYANLVVLPLTLICLVPLLLIHLCVLCYYAVFIVCFSCEARIDRFSDCFYFAYLIKTPFFCAAGACFCAALLESFLACLLTMGIVL